ncbi:MAG TPA: carbohydrate-binding family 9-like protein [Daejeonella sp.]|uniref:carbohydrate-binding family 9-like protein n=1 Tax=Daejeonella sp. TaxID=2805397 RepID=UPI002EDAC6E8
MPERKNSALDKKETILLRIAAFKICFNYNSIKLSKAATSTFIILFVGFNTIAQVQSRDSGTFSPVYEIVRLKHVINIDGNWDKPEWKKVKSIEIKNFIRTEPKFRPMVQAKMMYDSENVYVIFRVQDRNVRSITTEINGPVWKDSAIEFFFSPDSEFPLNFFNLEVNCGGTPLLEYNPNPRIGPKPVPEDIKKIEIGHSLPTIVDPEISGPLTWTVEYRIPLDMLENYSKISRPEKGVIWKANFYKIAEITSNPHYASWSPITHPKPQFHLPQYFGTLKFL